jgi:deoxyribonucleoside regulator
MVGIQKGSTMEIFEGNDQTSTEDEIETMVRAARLYYEQDQNQVQIARQLATSRSTVSRLLQRARQLGIVKISIRYPWERHLALEDQLCKLFNLHAVRVLDGVGRSAEEVIDGLGQLAAQFLDPLLKDGMLVGISFGRSLASTIKHLQPTRKVNMTVIQIIGALGSSNPLLEGPDLVRELASQYGAAYRYLHAPLIVEDRRMRDLLVQEPSVQETLTLGQKAELIMIGIGSLQEGASGPIWIGYLSEREKAWLRNIGAVGHMCAQFFDITGNLLDVEVNQRVIGIGIDTLRETPEVIAVAGSKEKAEAILGALRGGYINSLITDEQAAREILRLAG